MSMLDTKERREVFEQDRSLRQGTTFSEIASSDLGVGGRFSPSKPVVIGQDTLRYPSQPSGPWRRDPVPTEPPLGFSVNDQEAVGTPSEIEASRSKRDETEKA
jgi:hypothetical protein